MQRALERRRAERDRWRKDAEALRARATEPDPRDDELRAAREECDRLRGELEDAASWKADLEAAHAERDRLRVERDDLRNRLTTGQEEEGRLASVTKERDEARAELGRLENELRSARDEVKAHRRTVEELKGSLEEATARHEAAFDGLKREYEESRGRVGGGSPGDPGGVGTGASRAREGSRAASPRRSGEGGCRAQAGGRGARCRDSPGRTGARGDPGGPRPASSAGGSRARGARRRFGGRSRRSGANETSWPWRVTRPERPSSERSRPIGRKSAGWSKNSRRPIGRVEEATRRGDELAALERELRDELERERGEREAERQGLQNDLATLGQQWEAARNESDAERRQAVLDAEMMQAEHARALARLEAESRAAAESTQVEHERALAQVRAEFTEPAAERIGAPRLRTPGGISGRDELDAQLTLARSQVEDLAEQLAQSREATFQVKSLLKRIGIRLD